jgi:hypothetical protein
VKLLFTSVTLVLLVWPADAVYPIGPDVPLVSFAAWRCC